MAATVTRYEREDEPSTEGQFVRFADVEEALRDNTRLAWLRPVIEGDDDDAANRRTMALAQGLLVGLTGNELVDYAMTRCPP